MEPGRTLNRFLSAVKSERAESTCYDYRSSLSRSIGFCREDTLENVCEINGFHVSDFKYTRRNDGISETTHITNSTRFDRSCTGANR